MDMNNADDRAALIDALREQRLTAHEDHVGGGIHVVSVALLPDDGAEALSVTASGIDAPCEIGLSGLRTLGGEVIECGSAEFLHPETQEQAVDAFATYWSGREAFISDLRAGKYDL